MLKNFSKSGVVIVTAVVCSLFIMVPAKAFYLEVPQFAKDAWKMLKSIQASAQEAGTDSTIPSVNQESPMNPEQPMNQERPTEPAPQPPQSAPAPKCIINGQEMPMSSCPEFNQQPQQPQQPRYEGGSEGGGQNYGPGPGDRSEEDMKKQEARQLQDMKRGAKQMETQLKRFEIALKSAEKKGTTISQEIKDKATQARELINKIKNATTVEEMGETALDELNSLLQELEEIRQNIFEAAQRLDGLKRGMKGMATGIKMFEKQIASLVKQKITIPADVTENLTKVKAIMDAVNNAKTWEEVENAGIEDIQELMMNLDESRDQLEMLARWPKTLKQMDKELKNLQSALKKAKTTVTKLQKKEIDLTSNYDQFVAAVDKMKAVRDDAVAKMATGESSEAFDLIESDFFGQMEDTWSFQQIIETMNNLGRFTSQYKSEMNKANNSIKKLEKKKVDVAELKELYAEAREKGDGVVALIKVKPIDTDAVLTALEDFEIAQQEFGDKLEELGGETSGPMPWEQGSQQFKPVQMNKGVTQYLPAKKEPQEQDNSGTETVSAPVNGNTTPAQTCNVNGVEMPGACPNYQ